MGRVLFLNRDDLLVLPSTSISVLRTEYFISVNFHWLSDGEQTAPCHHASSRRSSVC